VACSENARPLDRGAFAFVGPSSRSNGRTPWSRATNLGFTAIELALVIAATALIGALGVSAWHTYVVRAQVAAAVARAAETQDLVTHAFRRSGLVPVNRLSAGLSSDGREGSSEYVESTQIVNGRIDLHFGSRADAAIAGRTVALTPFESADQRVVWICGNRTPGPGLQPLGFSGGARQAAQGLTTIETRYLPEACR
jgi:hypothetical protein